MSRFSRDLAGPFPAVTDGGFSVAMAPVKAG
jgi:hypothetical protein